MVSLISLLNLGSTAYKTGKLVKKGSDFIREDRELKRKNKELNEKISNIKKRSVFEAAIIYFLCSALAFWFSSFGILAIVFVIALFLSHCNELNNLKAYVSIKREILFSIICAACYILYVSGQFIH